MYVNGGKPIVYFKTLLKTKGKQRVFKRKHYVNTCKQL